jgi:hypothetical protein
MIIRNINEFNHGWFIGNFPTAILQTDQFEVALISCEVGIHPTHYHLLATEYNVLIEGKLRIGDRILTAGDVYVIDKCEVTEQEFLEPSKVLCVKTPSVIGDKYLI